MNRARTRRADSAVVTIPDPYRHDPSSYVLDSYNNLVTMRHRGSGQAGDKPLPAVWRASEDGCAVTCLLHPPLQGPCRGGGGVGDAATPPRLSSLRSLRRPSPCRGG